MLKRRRMGKNLERKLLLQKLKLCEHILGRGLLLMLLMLLLMMMMLLLLLLLLLLDWFLTGEAEHWHGGCVHNGSRRHVHSAAVIYTVQPRHFVGQVHAQQLHSAENHNEHTAVHHGPCNAGHATDYLLSKDVAAAVGNTAVKKPSASLSRRRVIYTAVIHSEGRTAARCIGPDLLVYVLDVRGISKEANANGACIGNVTPRRRTRTRASMACVRASKAYRQRHQTGARDWRSQGRQCPWTPARWRRARTCEQ